MTEANDAERVLALASEALLLALKPMMRGGRSGFEPEDYWFHTPAQKIVAEALASARLEGYRQGQEEMRERDRTPRIVVSEKEIEAALRAFYEHTAVQNFPTVAKDMMEHALQAAAAVQQKECSQHD